MGGSSQLVTQVFKCFKGSDIQIPPGREPIRLEILPIYGCKGTLNVQTSIESMSIKHLNTCALN